MVRQARGLAVVATVGSWTIGTLLAGCSSAAIEESEVDESFGSLRAVSDHSLDCGSPTYGNGDCTISVTLDKRADAGDIAAAIEVGEKLRRDDLTVNIETNRPDGTRGASIRFSEDVPEGPASKVLEHVTLHAALGSATVHVGERQVVDYWPKEDLPAHRVVAAARELAELGEGMPVEVDQAVQIATGQDAWPTDEAKLFAAAAEEFPDVESGIMQAGVVLLRLPAGSNTSPVRRFLTSHPSYDASDVVLATSDPRIDLTGASGPFRRSAVDVTRVLAATPGWTTATADGPRLRVEVDDLDVAQSVHQALEPLDGPGDPVLVDYVAGPRTLVELAPGDEPLFDLAGPVGDDPEATSRAFTSVRFSRRDDGDALVTAKAAAGTPPQELGRLLARTWVDRSAPLWFEVWLGSAGAPTTFRAAPTVRPEDDALPAPVLRALRRGWAKGLS